MERRELEKSLGYVQLNENDIEFLHIKRVETQGIPISVNVVTIEVLRVYLRVRNISWKLKFRDNLPNLKHTLNTRFNM